MSSVNAPNMHSYPPQHLMELNNDFLLTQIKNQVEFYFAPQNLQNDRFLQSQLNATDHLGAVAIQVICSFRKIRQLYSYSRSGYYPHDVDMPADPALLRMALATSSVVSISHDGMWIVPNLQKDPQKDSSTEATVASVPSSPSSSQDGSYQLDRSTIILREIANTVTEAMVLEAFANFNIKAARSETGDTWHLVFGSPEDAAAALEAGMKLDGKPIQGSLKSDMSNVPALPLPPPAPQAPVIGNPNVVGYQGQYPMHPPPQYNYVPMQYGMPQMMPQYPMQPQYYPQPQYRYFTPNGQRQQGGPPPQNVFVRPANENNRMKRRNNGNKRRNRRPQQNNTQQQQDDKPSRKDSNRNSNSNKKNQEKKQVKEIDLSREHFPSLGGGGGGTDTSKPVSTNVTGYAQALKKTSTPRTESVEQALEKMAVTEST